MENKLLSVDCTDKIEKKNGFNYLSWAFAWGEFIKVYPDALFEVVKDENNLPIFGNAKMGYMCYTKVTAGNITHEMWLPVMDYRNKAILDPNMFDVNKTVMRCLVKNLAMFGLGLYIYAGEDLPEPPQLTEDEKKEIEIKKEILEIKKQIGIVLVDLTKAGVNKAAIKNSIKHHLGVEELKDCNDIEKLKEYYLKKSNDLINVKKGEVR